MQLLPDVLSDDTHRKRDQEILAAMTDASLSSVSEYADLLGMILHTSGDILDIRYANPVQIRELYKKNPDLMQVVRDSFFNKSFKDIRNLSMKNSQQSLYVY